MVKPMSFMVMKVLLVSITFAQAPKRDAGTATRADMANLTIVTVNDVCDSLVWPSPFGQTITYYQLSNHDGFLTGTNSFGDIAKGNFFDLSSATANFVTRAIVGLGPVNGANGGNQSKPVNIKVLDGTSGTPGAVLGMYAGTLGEMAGKANKLNVFVFDPAVPLPASKKIFLVLEYPTLSWNNGNDPTTKDTLTLLSTAYNQATPSSAWEQRANQNWYDMEDAWGDININLHIYPLVSSVAVNCNPLPVAFGDFSGLEKANGIELNWQTLSEQGNSHFEVERSVDARKFAAVGRVSSKSKQGFSTALLRYRFTDGAPAAGVNYYRIRQIDVDGASTFTPTIKVTYRGPVRNSIVVQYYPNPAAQQLTIQLGAGAQDVDAIRFSDASGKILSAEKPAIAGDGLIRVSTRNLSSGLYYATILLSNGQQETFKVIKP